MRKVTYAEFESKMFQFNEKHSNGHDDCTLTGVIVYKQENWDKPYTLEERSYEVNNHCNGFRGGLISGAIWGNCLDGKDVGVRLDWYNWKVEYCYFISKEEQELVPMPGIEKLEELKKEYE